MQMEVLQPKFGVREKSRLVVSDGHKNIKIHIQETLSEIMSLKTDTSSFPPSIASKLHKSGKLAFIGTGLVVVKCLSVIRDQNTYHFGRAPYRTCINPFLLLQRLYYAYARNLFIIEYSMLYWCRTTICW